jgi:hypothetical protein
MEKFFFIGLPVHRRSILNIFSINFEKKNRIYRGCPYRQTSQYWKNTAVFWKTLRFCINIGTYCNWGIKLFGGKIFHSVKKRRHISKKEKNTLTFFRICLKEFHELEISNGRYCQQKIWVNFTRRKSIKRPFGTFFFKFQYKKN